MSDIERMAVCYHEAGHAVVADWLDFPVYELSVDPSKIPDRAGGAVTVPIYGGDDIQESRSIQGGVDYRRSMILVSTAVLMAGNAAMQIYESGFRDFNADRALGNGAGDDYQRAYAGAFEFWRRHDRAAAALIGAHFEAVKIIESQWDLVVTIAERLNCETTFNWTPQPMDREQNTLNYLANVRRFIRNYTAAGVA